MAKATEIDVNPWEPYGLAGARIVRSRADELFEQSHDVLDTEDIERVHDMRVASRRLRAVLEIFAPCFPKAEFRDVLRDVKRLADALGERRDPDVHIDAMRGFAAALEGSHRHGVERLIDRLQEQQAAGNVTLEAELQRAEENDLRARLHALADHAEEALA